MHWVLIFGIVSPGPAGTMNAQLFETKQACYQAGTAFVGRSDALAKDHGEHGRVSFYCAPYDASDPNAGFTVDIGA